jgi:hypothetical protein
MSPVPEPAGLAALHARELPQKDQLCGAFWGALAAAGHQVDQDDVALRAGTTLAEGDPSGWLPPGASPRTDYRLSIPVAADEPSSGTSATGVARAVEELSGRSLAVVPVAGPWSAGTVVSLLEVVSAPLPGLPPAARSSPTCAPAACGAPARAPRSSWIISPEGPWSHPRRTGTAATSSAWRARSLGRVAQW